MLGVRRGQGGRWRTAPRALALGLLAAVVVTTTSCSLGEKSAQAERIIDSVELARDQRTVTGTYSISMRIVSLPIAGSAAGALGVTGGGGAAADPTTLGYTPEVTTDVAIDLVHDRAVLSSPKGDRYEYFDDLVVQGYRYDATAREARPWVMLDLRELEDGDAALDPTQDAETMLLHLINPAVFLDLAAGALTGSVEQGRVKTINDLEATRYRANFDIDKTLNDTREDRYPEDRRDDLEEMLEVFGLRGTVHEGELWLDDDGLPRRFVERLELEPLRGFRIDVKLRLDLVEYGKKLDLAPPTPDQIVAVDTVVGFARSLVPPEVASLQGQMTRLLTEKAAS